MFTMIWVLELYTSVWPMGSIDLSIAILIWGYNMAKNLNNTVRVHDFLVLLFFLVLINTIDLVAELAMCK